MINSLKALCLHTAQFMRKSLRNVLPRSSDFDYQISKITLSLPSGHLLPVYQRDHPRYDKFLAHLAIYLPRGSVVIDVGANCGDTLAAMASANNCLHFFCVEADPGFYSYLLTNIDRIRSTLGFLSVKTVNAFAGRNLSNVKLVGNGSTKKAVLVTSSKDQIVSSETLDSLVDSAGIKSESISLIKTDTDGYDFDVINSASQTLQAAQPIVFFECQCDTRSQQEEYLRMVDYLAGIGYCKWAIFDNFGALVTQTSDVSQLRYFLEYLLGQIEGQSTRTIFYFDVMASTSRDSGLLAESLLSY